MSRSVIKYVLFVSVVLVCDYSLSQTNTWNGSVDNDWHDGCNWSLGTVPTATHTVVIPTAGTYPNITGNAHCLQLNITSTAVNSLTISGTGNLCISSTNTGPCSTGLTDNTSGGAPANNTTSSADLCYNDFRTLTGTPGGGTFSVIVGNGSISGGQYGPNTGDAGNTVTIRYTVTGCGGPTTDDVTFNVLPPFAFVCAGGGVTSSCGFSCDYRGACGGCCTVCHNFTNTTTGTVTLNFPFSGGYVAPSGNTIAPGATASVCKNHSASPFCLAAQQFGDITWSSTSGEFGSIAVIWD